MLPNYALERPVNRCAAARVRSSPSQPPATRLRARQPAAQRER
jgi:hypothetical protein